MLMRVGAADSVASGQMPDPELEKGTICGVCGNYVSAGPKTGSLVAACPVSDGILSLGRSAAVLHHRRAASGAAPSE